MKTILYLSLIFLLFSCKEELDIKYRIDEISMTTTIRIHNWNIADLDSLNKNGSFIIENKKLKILGKYESIDGVVDLLDNSLKEKITQDSSLFFLCILEVEKEIKTNLIIKYMFNTSILTEVWLNSKLLVKPDIFDFNYYKLNLNIGTNILVIKASVMGKKPNFEANICGDQIIIEEYAKKQNGRIISPIISSKDKVFYLSNKHQEVTESNLELNLYSVDNQCLSRYQINKPSSIFSLPKIEKNKVYLSELSFGSVNISQAFIYGSPDEMYKNYLDNIDKINSTDMKQTQIKALLIRMKFLLDHKHRKENKREWDYKVAQIAYMIEYELINFNKNPDKGKQLGIYLKTYISKLDNSYQRYLLVIPDNYRKTEEMPLVVVIRPNIENKYHFFTSPQIAHYKSLSNAKSLANKYNYIVIMPEARLYLEEKFIPFADSEILCAIESVKADYNIDSDKIYLQGNCSAGYRALKLATKSS